jgi:hypothetical protein
MTAGLALAWGLVVAGLFRVCAGRAARGSRPPLVHQADPAGSPRAGEERPPRIVDRLRKRRAARVVQAEQARDLPILIEVLGVAIASGSTPLLALEQSRSWVPPSCGGPIDGVIRAYALGAAFPAALARGLGAVPAFAPLVDALSATDTLGIAVGPELARVASGCREAQRRSAEQRARSMSVRLLFPLVFLVLPAFGLLTVVPVLVAGLHRL